MAYNHAEKILNEALKIKQQIQKLEAEQAKNQKIWREAAKKVRSITWEIKEKQALLLDTIQT